MAWYPVDYSCGHSNRVQLYGKEVDRMKRLDWLEEGVCEACYKQQLADARVEEAAKAASVAEAYRMCELEGSEKQVSWALSLRQKAFETLVAAGADPFKTAAVIGREPAAKWWIENRDRTTAFGLARMLAANYTLIDEIRKEGEPGADA